MSYGSFVLCQTDSPDSAFPDIRKGASFKVKKMQIIVGRQFSIAEPHYAFASEGHHSCKTKRSLKKKIQIDFV